MQGRFVLRRIYLATRITQYRRLLAGCICASFRGAPQQCQKTVGLPAAAFIADMLAVLIRVVLGMCPGMRAAIGDPEELNTW